MRSCLDDTNRVECLPNEDIFTELARIGYEKPPPKLIVYKAFFSAQWKFLIHTLVQCVSTKRTTWNEFSCSMASAIICLATGRKFNFFKYIFDNMVRNVDIPTMFLMYSWFLQVIINNQVDDLSSHNIKYTSPALTQKVFANIKRVGKGFSRVETPLFALIMVQPQPHTAAVKEEEEDDIPTALTPPSPTNAPSPLPRDPIPTPPQAQPSTPSSPPHRFLSSKKGKEVREEEEIKAFRVKEVEEGKIEAIDADEDITLVDVETQEEVADIDAELQGRIDDVSAAATKDVNVAEPTVFDDEEVTMTMAQTLIKMKAKKVRLLDEQMAKRLHDEEVEKAATKEKQEKNDLEKAKGLQQQYDDKQENIDGNAIAEQIQGKHLDNIRKYQSLKRKPVSIAQARKNMIIYLKNMAGYKMEHFRDVHNMLEIIPVSEFKVEALQVKYPIIDWEIHSKGSRTYWKIIIVGGITEAYQIFEYILKGFDREDMVTLWRLVKEKFKKNYPLSNGVMTLMLSAKLQVKEDSNMARDLVMKIFMEANKPKSGSLDTSSNISAAGSRLILLGKDDYAAEGLKKLL
nr:hypothetical protein [Tanacetum cinerariifolium]